MDQLNSQQPIIDLQPGQGQQPYYSQQPLASNKTQVLSLDFNIAGLLCYVPFGVIFAVIFLATEPKESRFVRFHSLQSVMLLALAIVFSIVLSIVGTIFSYVPVIGWMLALLMIPVSLVVSLAFLVMAIIAMIKAYQNEMWKMPVISKLVENFEAKQTF